MAIGLSCTLPFAGEARLEGVGGVWEDSDRPLLFEDAGVSCCSDSVSIALETGVIWRRDGASVGCTFVMASRLRLRLGVGDVDLGGLLSAEETMRGRSSVKAGSESLEDADGRS